MTCLQSSQSEPLVLMMNVLITLLAVWYRQGKTERRGLTLLFSSAVLCHDVGQEAIAYFDARLPDGDRKCNKQLPIRGN